MKHILRWCAALVALAFALPAQAVPDAVKISSASLAKNYNPDGSLAGGDGKGGFGGGAGINHWFDGKKKTDGSDMWGGGGTYLASLANNGYCVLDFSSVMPGGYNVTKVCISQCGEFPYSIYWSKDGSNWTAVPDAQNVCYIGEASYDVNKVATQVKIVFNQTGGWSLNICEIEVWGYEPPQPVKISSASLAKNYNPDGSLAGGDGKGGFGGGAGINHWFDGKKKTDGSDMWGGGGTYLANLANNGYCVLDFSSVMPGGYYITSVNVSQCGEFPYSIYSSSDGTTWTEVPNAQNVSYIGEGIYDVNKIATHVKIVFNQTGGWSLNICEIEVWGLDPADVACDHPSYTEWTPVAGTATCTQPGIDERFCAVCHERFTRISTTLLALSHDYHATLTAPGTASGYGSGYVECSRCNDFHLDFNGDTFDLATLAGIPVNGVKQYADLTASSTGGQDGGITPSDVIDNNWTDSWNAYWFAASLSHNEYIQFLFGTTIELTKIEYSVLNQDQTVDFYKYDPITDEETLLKSIVIVKDETVGAPGYQRKTVYFFGGGDGGDAVEVDAIRMRIGDVLDPETGAVVKRYTGTQYTGSTRNTVIIEVHPWGTIAGAGMIQPAAMIGNVGYETLAEAVEAVASNAVATTITVQDDLDLTGTANNIVIPAGKNVTLDLNGHTIAADVDGDILVQGALTLTDLLGGGKIYAVAPTGNRGIIRVEGGTFTMAGGAIESVPDPSDPGENGSYAVVYRANSTVNVTGGSITAGWFCLSGNGNDKTGKESAVTISGGTLLSTADYAVFFPNAGTLSITGGQISGAAGALAAKNGTVSITGGTFLSSGTGDIQPGTDGTAGLGDVAVNIVGQYGPTEATISGGSFTAQENAVVLSAGANGATLAVSGGTFSQAVPDEYCAEGFFPADNGSGTYGVEYRPVAKIGQNGYSTLANAVAAAKDGDTVELTTNVTLTARVEPNAGAGTAITIDLGGFTVAREGTDGNGSVFDVKSGSVIVTNGVIDCTQDDAAIVKDGVYAITARSGAAVTLADLVVAVDSQAGACVYPFAGATVAIQSGTYSNATATAYQYHANWTGMAVNQANKAATGGSAVQLVTIYGGSFYLVDPALGDDSWADGEGTFLAPGRISVLTDGFYVVQPGWKVSFANEKGEAPAMQLIALDGENDVFATEPTPAPQAEGFNFTGWFAAGAAEAFDFANTPIVADVELTAGWEASLVVQPIDLDAQTFSADEVAAGAVPAGIQTDPVSGIESFVVNFHGQGGVTYTLQGSTSLNPADWKSEALVKGEPVPCVNNGDLVTLSFPLSGDNVPEAMFFKIGASRTAAP